MENFYKVFLKTTLLVLGVFFSYQAQAQICIAAVENDANCGNNGCASATITGGAGPYTYVWHDLTNSFPPTTSISITNQKCNLPEGDYYCVITDANSVVCTTNTVTILNTAASLSTFTSVPISCNGLCDGEFNVFAQPFGGNYTYTWSDDPSLSNIIGTGGTLPNACAGAYYVELNDIDNSCIDTFPVFMLEPDPILITVDNVTDVTCFGDGDGSINVTTTGPGPLAFDWQDVTSSTVSTAEDLVSVGGGDYSLIVSNANCSDTVTQTILEPLVLEVSLLDSANVSCFGVFDGAIDVDVTGGNGNPNYTWTGPAGFSSTQQDINALECGSYDLNVTDLLGCSASFNHNIPCPSPINIVLDSLILPSCFGSSDGEIYVTVSGGTPASSGYDYDWNGVFNTEDLTGVPSNNYTLVVNDSNTCIGNFNVSLNQPAILEASVQSITDASCFGSTDGSVEIRIDGGTLDYTLSLYDDLSNLLGVTTVSTGLINYPVPGAGTYTFVIEDDKGCQTTISNVVVDQPTEIIIALDSVNNVSCLGSGDAEIYVTVSGGAGGYGYSWSGPSCNTCPSEDITSISAGLYTLTVTDVTTCTQTFVQNVTVPSALSINVDSLIDVSCRDSADAILAVTASGGTSPYTFLWNGPNGYTNTDSIGINLDIGQYNIDVTDDNGCVESLATQVISQPIDYLTASLFVDSVNCFGEGNGTISAIPFGGTGPYFYSWSDGQNVQSAIDLIAGTYTLLLEDAKGCLFTDSAEVEQPDLLLANLIQVPENCNQLDGQVIASPTGGTTPYTYAWNSNPGLNANTLTGLDGGTFIPEIITITDAKGCSVIDQITVQEALPISLAGSVITDVSCFQGADGQIEVDVVGGVTPYSYQWFSNVTLTNPVPSANILNDFTLVDLNAGSYYLSITDASGCNTILPAFIVSERQTASLEVSINTNQSVFSLACFGDVDGLLVTNVTGGTPFPGPHYQYTLNGVLQSQISGIFSGLEAGDYDLIVHDNNGCEDMLSFQVVEPDDIETDLSQSSISCFGGSDGAVTAVTTGGTPDYLFDWSQGTQETTSGSSTISDLAVNTYTLVVTDNNGCTDTASIVLTQPDFPLDLAVSYSNETCRNEDGTASVSVQGGTAGYSYNWTYDYDQLQPIFTSLNDPNPTASSPNLTDVYNGWYYVTVTDTNSCIEKDSVLIGLDSSPEIIASQPIHPLCYGDSTGQVSVSAINGNPDYEFAYNGFNYDIVQVFTGLADGTHIFTVRDSLGCIDTAIIEIIQPDAVLADSMEVTPTNCNGDSNGEITAFISGGTVANAYSYQWYNPNGGPAYPANLTGITQTLTDLSAGIYTLNVSDDNGCSFTTTAEVTEPLVLSSTSFVTSSYNNQDISCFGICDASAQVAPFGGVAPYTFQWSSGSQTDIDQDLCAGTYTIEVTDFNSCVHTATVEITQPTEVSVTIPNVTHIKCAEASTGIAIADAIGGTPSFNGYTYFWSALNDLSNPLSLTETLSDVPIGTYQVLVTDLNGCFNTANVTINDDDAFTLGAPILSNVSCFGYNDGSANLNPINGTPPYSHSWSDPLNQQTATAISLSPGIYTNIMYDSEGCEIIASIEIEQPSLLEITSANVTEVSCYNADDGSIELVAQGGVSPYGYSIDCNNYNNNSTLGGLNPGIYAVCVTDANGCIVEQENIIIDSQPSQVVIDDLDVTDISCFGFNDGSATVTASGGTGSLSYSWSNSQTSATANGFSAGPQLVLVTDANGCDISQSFSIEEPTQIVVDSIVIDNYCAQVSEAVITVYSHGGTDALSYFANNNPSPDYEINGLTIGQFNVSIQDVNGCSVDSSVIISDPNIIAFNNETICLGDSVFMDALVNFDSFQTFTWQDSAFISSESSITVYPEETTSYLVSAWDNGCYAIQPFTDTIPITVNIPIIDAGEDVGIMRGEEAMLSVSGVAPYFWSTLENTQNIMVNPLLTTYYTAYAVDPLNGCLGMDSVRVFVGMNEGFSPNADGYNDSWELTYLNQYPSLKVEVFNRWGSKLWESIAPNIVNWDGTHEGVDLPTGTYYYIISFDDSENRDPLSGPVTIVR